MRARLAVFLVAMGVLLGASASADAHPSHWLTANAEIRRDGTFVVDVFLDREFVRESFGSAAPAVEIAGLPAAKDLRQESYGLLDAFSVLLDGRRVATDALWIPPRREEEIHLRLAGALPPGARTIVFENRANGPWGVSVWEVGDERPMLAMLDPHQPMTPVELHTAPPAKTSSAIEFVELGFAQFVIRRLDHVLFVIALLLLSTRLRHLVVQTSAFTAACAAGVVLAATNVVSISASVSEPLVAASIACAAIGNLFTQKLHPARVLLVAGFGLVHGVVLAGAFAERGLPSDGKAAALFAFTVGVVSAEFGVIAVAWPALCTALRGKPWRRARVVVPASIAIAAVGLWWAATRAL